MIIIIIGGVIDIEGEQLLQTRMPITTPLQFQHTTI